MKPVDGTDIEAFVAGELSPADADRVLAAVAANDSLALELDDALQARALAEEVRAAERAVPRQVARATAARATDIAARVDRADVAIDRADDIAAASTDRAPDIAATRAASTDRAPDIAATRAAASTDRAPDIAATRAAASLADRAPDIAADVRPIGSARKSRARLVVAIGVPLAAAAAVAIYLALPKHPAGGDAGGDVDAKVVAALAPSRSIQPRLAWRGADHFRPYDAPRAATAPAEHLSFDLLAELEKQRDPRAVIAAQILVGNRSAAAAELAKAPPGADAASDRAALALLGGDPDRAIIEASDALAREPAHAQARWNRALALEALGLDAAAAARFDEIAATGEAGWSAEAKAHAQALAGARERRTVEWAESQAAGTALVDGRAQAIEAAAKRAETYPAVMRIYFYDAVRAAPSAGRVRAIGPLADALDRAAGGTVLRAYVDRIAALPAAAFAVRAKLAPRYVQLVRGALAPDDAAAFVRDVRAADRGGVADDVLIGALVAAGPKRYVAAEALADFERLAAATRDPWFDLLAAEQRGWVELERDTTGDAEVALRTAIGRCGPALDYRCARLGMLLTVAYINLHRLDAARAALAAARRAAATAGAPNLDDWLLMSGGKLAFARDEIGGSGQPIALAYLDEMERRGLPCATQQLARDGAAQALVSQGRLDDARRTATACTAPPTFEHVYLLAQMLDRADAAAVAQLRSQITALRDTGPLGDGQRALLDAIEGGTLLAQHPDDARTMLHRSITDAARAKDTFALDAREHAYAVLVDDAGRRAAWADALSLLAAERGAPMPTRCALGAADDSMTTIVVRGADSQEHGVYRPREAAIPEEMRKLLAGCERVDVFARHPYYGRSALLPPELAWRFRATRAAGSSEPAGPSAGPTLVVANVQPPAALALPPLNPIAAPAGATLLEGAAATPARALAAMGDAAFVEIHSHGLTDLGGRAALLVLSPDASGAYALTAEDIAKAHFRARPVVVLAACDAAAAGSALASTGLADSFVAAGASAVIASPSPIEDAAAPRFFAGVRARIAAGAEPAAALAAERASWHDPAQRRWIDDLVVFQ